MKQFSQAVIEKIGYYVYVLKDPRNSEIFYIGKGVGNRVFQHALGAIETEHHSDKLNLIREIQNTGNQVEHYILRHGLEEKEALMIESACIDLIGLDILTNQVKGHHSWDEGLKTIDEIVQYYDAKIITITEPAIIININRKYKRFMNEIDLYNATRSAWKLGVKKNKAQYAIASYRGLVREIYEIDTWNQVGDRWEFVGKVANNEIGEKYRNQSLVNYIKKGNQNPIKYTY